MTPWRAVWAAAVVMLVASNCSTDAAPASVHASAPVEMVLDTIASGLSVPWAIAFAPDGRIFVTERPGRIRVVDHGALAVEPWATLSVEATGEAGLMGIVIAPDFPTSHAVYVVGTFASGGGLVNRVVRLTDENGHGANPSIIVDSIPATSLHSGDAIAFGPDGMLYVATGDAREPSRSADRSSMAGKILRYTPAGGVPPDNPIAGSPVYALGFRNPQGLAWSTGGQLFATDHGPSGFANEDYRHDTDEINAVVRGGDHGWPAVAGFPQLSRTVGPLAVWTPAIAPSGLAMPGAASPESWRHSLFIGGLRGEQLRRVDLDSTPMGWTIRAQTPLFEHTLGRIRAVAVGPDGDIYFTTSNRDGRGLPHPGDDHLLRLSPKH
jgi:glucose/arabinose dehydrogenase